MKRKKGFTLVELLVVISIIALLLSILMPSLNKARQQAIKMTCLANVKSLVLSDDIYANEYNDFYVPVLGGPETTYKINGQTFGNATWYQNTEFAKIVGYAGERYSNRTANNLAANTTPDKYKCKADKRTVANKGLYMLGGQAFGVSYGINRMGLLKISDKGWDYSKQGGFYSFRRGQIKRPTEKYEFMDAMDYTVWDQCMDYITYWNKSGDKFFLPNGTPAWDCPSYRHNEGITMGYFDGRAQYLRKQEAWQVGGTTAVQCFNNSPHTLPIGLRYADQPYPPR